jgi:hypothetical protein
VLRISHQSNATPQSSTVGLLDILPLPSSTDQLESLMCALMTCFSKHMLLVGSCVNEYFPHRYYFYLSFPHESWTGTRWNPELDILTFQLSRPLWMRSSVREHGTPAQTPTRSYELKKIFNITPRPSHRLQIWRKRLAR